MPNTLRLAEGGYMRRYDVENILHMLYSLHCVEVVGFSNVGKSALMRLLAQPDVWIQELGEAGRDFLPVYIDCNHMLAMSDHGFYELVLRSLQESAESLAHLSALSEAYATVVSPPSEFQAPLSFNRGLMSVLQATDYKLLLLFDEFDEPFTHIDSRVFINLRALKDRFGPRLAYVTATEQPLARRRPEEHCAEFCELFSHHMWRLAPLTRTDVERFIRRYMTAFEVHFTAADVDFVYEWAGGHPRLLNGVCRLLEAALDGDGLADTDPTERWHRHDLAARQLRRNEELAIECEKIWRKLSDAEQAVLGALAQHDEGPDEETIASLLRQHVLMKVEGRHQPFSHLFADYVQRKSAPATPVGGALWLDAERGEVLVNGRPVETLTNLEYRLVALLFGQRDRIIDKYQIVTGVWGEEYIDEVDDARIEKLVSRVRQKIESDPSAPRFLTTIRGRGYRLTIE